jgi:hypothetical protein
MELGGRRRRGCEGHQRGGVDQPEHEEGEADRADTGVARAEAADDRDPDDVVEAARERGTSDRSGAAGGGEGHLVRALRGREQAVPAEGLEGVREQKESPGGPYELEVGVGEGPARLGEVPGGEDGDADAEHGRKDIERDPALAGPAQIDERSHVLHHRRVTQRTQPAKGYEWVTGSR